MLKILPVLTTLVLCLGVASAQAQNNWLETAKSVLNSAAAKSTASSATGTAGKALSNDQITAGLKEALNVSAKEVVAQLSKTGGFNLDPKIRIPLPSTLARVDTALKAVGMGSMTTDLQDRMNRAAELATPKAQALFVDAIKKMTITDARDILSSKQDAATQYLRKIMGAQLAADMKPIIADTMAQTGAVKAYDAAVGKYNTLPMVSSVKTNMNDYVANKAMDGIFYYIAQEEAAIRQDPAARTTDLLKKVFSQK